MKIVLSLHDNFSFFPLSLSLRVAYHSNTFFCKQEWSMAYSPYTTHLTRPNVSLPSHFVLIYLGLCMVTVVCNFIRTVIQYRGSLRASNRLFLGLLQSVCHAPLQFFEVTPISQIISRFNKDMETIDSSIGWHVNFLLQTIFGVFGVVLTIGVILPEFFAATFIAGKVDKL